MALLLTCWLVACTYREIKSTGIGFSSCLGILLLNGARGVHPPRRGNSPTEIPQTDNVSLVSLNRFPMCAQLALLLTRAFACIKTSSYSGRMLSNGAGGVHPPRRAPPATSARSEHRLSCRDSSPSPHPTHPRPKPPQSTPADLVGCVTQSLDEIC